MGPQSTRLTGIAWIPDHYPVGMTTPKLVSSCTLDRMQFQVDAILEIIKHIRKQPIFISFIIH